MLNLNKILDQEPVDNNVRRMRYQWAYREHFGRFPNFNKLLRECSICKKPLWIDPRIDTEPLKYTCSTKCDDKLDELRCDKHWS